MATNISNDDSNKIINGTSGDDSIRNNGSGVTVNSDKGNDIVYNSWKSSLVAVNTGAGNDSVSNHGNKVTISAGDGNDTIYNNSKNTIIDGGKGNDLISLSSSDENTVIKYSAGEGNDTVFGFNSTSMLQINGTYSTQASGNDFIIKVGKSTIRLKNAYATADSVNIITGGKSTALARKTITLTGNDDIKITRDLVSVVGSAGNDSINNRGNKVTILGGAGNDSINNRGDNVIISGDNGSDSIENNGSNVTIYVGTGNDGIYNNGDNVLFRYTSGNDFIRGFNETSTLNISGSSYSTTKSDEDIIVTVGDEQITLSGAATLSKVNIINLTPVTVTNSESSDVIMDSVIKNMNASKRTDAIKITGNALDNTIRGGSKNDTIYGGKGDDLIFGGAGNDTFIYKSGDGKDVIFGFEDADILQITGAFSTSVNSSGSEIYFKVDSTDNAITLKEFGETSTFNVNGISYKVSGSKLVEK